jgi:hypothetical protein
MSNNDEDIDSLDESGSIHSLLRPEPAIETRARANAWINQSAMNAASTAFGINLSTSSSAHTTPQVPQVGIPVTTNINSSASNSAASNGPTQVEIPTAQNITIEQASHLMQHLFLSEIRNSTSKPSTPAQVIPTAPVKQVPQAEYVTTSTAQSKLIEVIKFSNNRTSNRKMLKQLNFKMRLMGRVGNLSIRLKTSLGTLLTL